jgi:hypothetical protein
MIKQGCLYTIGHLEQSVFSVVMLKEKSGRRFGLVILSINDCQ